MAFCPHCGKPTEASIAFCTACGRGLSPEEGPSAATEPAPLPATPRVRPLGVTIIGVVAIFLGVTAAIASVVVLLIAIMGAAWAQTWLGDDWIEGAGGAFIAVVALLAAVMIAAFAALAIAAGVGSLKGRSWAWGLTIATMALNGLRGLGEVAMREVASGVITVLVSIVLIVYYFQPDVKAWFQRPV